MKSAGPAIAAATLALATLVLLYILSVGPAIWLHERQMLSDEVGEAVYGPLVWAANSTKVIGVPLEFYANLWIRGDSAPAPPPAATVAPAPAPSPPAPSGS